MFRYNSRKFMTTIPCLAVFLIHPNRLYAQEDIRCNIYLVGDCPPNYYAQQLKNAERLKKGLERVLDIFEKIPDAIPDIPGYAGYIHKGIDYNIKAANDLIAGQNSGFNEANAAYSPGGIDAMEKINDANLCNSGVKAACRH